MKFVKQEQHHTQVVSAHHVFQALCCLLFVVFTPFFSGCAPQTTAEIQQWGIIRYEDVYTTTQVIAPNGEILSETQTPSGVVKPVYGYYRQEVVVPPETRDSHDVFAIISRGIVTGAVTYTIYKILR